MANEKLILIVDNNRISNVFNKTVIEQTLIGERVVILENTKAALHFVNPKKSLGPYPSLIFLDLFMPEINGWEFITTLDAMSIKNDCDVIIMHNKHLLPEEEMKLNKYALVKAVFNSKILTKDYLLKFFNENKEIANKLKYS